MYSMQMVSVSSNTVIFEEGDQPHNIYFVQEGKLALFKSVYDSYLLNISRSSPSSNPVSWKS